MKWVAACIVLGCLVWRAAFLVGYVRAAEPIEEPGNEKAVASEVDRSPVDVALTPDQRWLVTANETSHTLSLIKVSSGEVVAEVACGRRPTAVLWTPDGKGVLATGSYSGTLHLFDLSDGTLRPRRTIQLGFQPRGVAVSPDGDTAYVALQQANAVAVVDLKGGQVIKRIPVGRWPRNLVTSPDGSRLAVGTSGDGSVSVIDTAALKMAHEERFVGLNGGQMVASADGKYAYRPFVTYGGNPISALNIRRGWVLSNRVARVRLDAPARREAIALDPQGEAVSDAHGVAISPDQQWLVVAASGTHELIVFRLAGLPFQDYGGPGDHIDPELLHDSQRFFRIAVGGRPMTIHFSSDGRRVFVANYLLNAVQIVDIEKRALVETIDLGGPSKPSLARDGEAIFLDGRRSLDQWYSCHTCHYEGGTNAVTMDTSNDGTPFTHKTVLPLYNVTRTKPWTWHGWQRSFKNAMSKSLLETMQGEEPEDYDVQALLAYFDALEPPPNPYRSSSGELSPSAERGKALFESDRAGCANCHLGRYFTDGEIHDVGVGGRIDKYEGFNTPTLIDIHNHPKFMHDGRADSLEDLLTGPHSPQKVSGAEPLSNEETRLIVEYLKAL